MFGFVVPERGVNTKQLSRNRADPRNTDILAQALD